MRRALAVTVGLALCGLAACGDDSGTSGATTTVSTTAVSTTTVSTTTVSTTAAPTTAAPTVATTATVATTTTVGTTQPPTTEPPTTTSACTPPTNTASRTGGNFPNGLSPIVGSDARLGVHPCYERFVIEFAGTGPFPGWWVRYEPLPVKADPSDLPVDLPGATAALVVTAQVWMPDPFENRGYQGPSTLPVNGYRTITAVKQTSNYEGTTVWAIGVDRQRGFSVMVLSNPARLVVDVAVG